MYVTAYVIVYVTGNEPCRHNLQNDLWEDSLQSLLNGGVIGRYIDRQREREIYMDRQREKKIYIDRQRERERRNDTFGPKVSQIDP